jgi:hypothetical protein
MGFVSEVVTLYETHEFHSIEQNSIVEIRTNQTVELGSELTVKKLDK